VWPRTIEPYSYFISSYLFLLSRNALYALGVHQHVGLLIEDSLISRERRRSRIGDRSLLGARRLSSDSGTTFIRIRVITKRADTRHLIKLP